MIAKSLIGQISRQFKFYGERLRTQLAEARRLGIIRRLLNVCRNKLTSIENNDREARALRFELCEARCVLSGSPWSPDGDGDGSELPEDVQIPVWVDGNFEFGDLNAQFPYGKENTFKLESNPSATKTIYMDFDGHHSVNNQWGHDIVFPAFDRNGNPNSFSDAELSEIQKQFLHVVEDFLPFDVNVTTKDPGVEALRKTGSNDNRWGVRSLNTQYTDGFGNGTGGIAYLNSFDRFDDTPAFTFNKGANVGGMTNSHEVGHALGLRHDGLGSKSYHPGTGSGPTGWGPIMGAPFGKNLVQWSNGDYANSTNTENDLAIITRSRNGFGFRPDDHGGGTGSATPLDVSNVVEVSGWGIIEKRSDVDYFSFAAGPGNLSIQIDTLANNASLDIEAKLYDAFGNLLQTSNPGDALGASFDLSVVGGNYFISVDGIGKPGVYSDYGSLGYYEISGVVVDPVNDPPTIDPLDDLVIDEDDSEMEIQFYGITAGENENQPLRVFATSDNSQLIPNPDVNYLSPNQTGFLNFQPLPDSNGTATIFVTVEDGGYDGDLSTTDDNATSTESFTVVVQPVNDPPTLDLLDDLTIAEDAGEQTVELAGISDGDEGFQPLRVTASSNNPGLIPTPAVDYTSPSATGQLKFAPVANQFGSAIISVTVEDGGDDNNLATTDDNLKYSRTFLVQVDPVNDPPTLAVIPDQTLIEDEHRSLVLSGISAGGGEIQPLKVWAVSSDTAVMADPVVDYTSDQETGTIHLVPQQDMEGTTNITVYIEDGGLDQDLSTTADNSRFSRVFKVNVLEENDLPTLNPLADMELPEDTGVQTVTLTGITAGSGESQLLKVTATSSNELLISDQVIEYTQGNTQGVLTFSPNVDRFGTAVITVTVEDSGLDGDLSTTGDNAKFSQTFEVVVTPVNDAPRFTAPAEVFGDFEQPIDEIALTEIDSGPYENQPLRFSVSTDSPEFLSGLQIDYTDPEGMAKITFDTRGQLGQGIVTVVAEDGGDDGNLDTRQDNATTTQTIVVAVTKKTIAFAHSDQTVFGLVEGTFGQTYWKNRYGQVITETAFGRNQRSRLEHHWQFNLPVAQLSTEFFVYASHDASNEQFRFDYRVDGTTEWKKLFNTNQNESRKYYGRVADPALSDGGVVWVRVRDTGRYQGDSDLASLDIQKIMVMSRGIIETLPAVNAFAFDRHASEGRGDLAQFRFQLADRERLDEDLEVYYEVGGTSSSGDYVEVLSGMKKIKAGKLMVPLVITPRDDLQLEGNESLTIKVLPRDEYLISGSPLARVTILDNEQVTYEAKAEVSYLGGHSVHYPESQFDDSASELISERLYGNRTKMNHQWRFDIAEGGTFNVRGRFEVTENSFVDDFHVAYSTDQKSWMGLGRVEFGQPLELNQTIHVDPGTENIWIRLNDRFRRAHDTHVAKVAVNYLQLTKKEVIGPALMLVNPSEKKVADRLISPRAEFNPTQFIHADELELHEKETTPAEFPEFYGHDEEVAAIDFQFDQLP